MKPVFHLIGNAHLDPVWLWDWREGANEGIITCAAILDLMEEFPDLTFSRGESVIYRHIETHAPSVFTRIKKMVRTGRWEAVGGTLLQPDTNLPDTETLCRQFFSGLNYFQSALGVRPTVAWAADSFGHSAGLPEILAAAGMKGIAFTRPGANIIDIPLPVFWWESPSGKKVLAYRPTTGWYGTQRDEIPVRLDETLAEAQKKKMSSIGVFYGMGNHGGGPTRRMLNEIRQWGAAHPEVELRFSGLHTLFNCLLKEIADGKKVPLIKGELNYCLRGCYVSAARFKTAYRKAESLAASAEKSAVIMHHTLTENTVHIISTKKNTAQKTAADCNEMWDAVLFNSFHDILPGSSIERAYEEQFDWIGSAAHQARGIQLAALGTLARAVDTRRSSGQPGNDQPQSTVFLIYNPHLHEFKGPVELEASLDYRFVGKIAQSYEELPLEVRAQDGSVMKYQYLPTEHSCVRSWHWRKRIVVNTVIPPAGWTIIEILLNQEKKKLIPVLPPPDAHTVSAYGFTVTARPGSEGIEISKNGKKLLSSGMRLATFDDPWGSWGGMQEEPQSCDINNIRHTWKIVKSEVLCRGPIRTVLAVKLAGGKSEMDMRISLDRVHAAVSFHCRLLWNERSARLKFILPASGSKAEYAVPGGSAVRTPSGEVPGGQWVKLMPSGIGIISDCFYGYNRRSGSFEISVCRASRYGDDVKTLPAGEPWLAVVDRGELQCRFMLTAGSTDIVMMSCFFSEPPQAAAVPPSPGTLPRTGSFASLTPETIKVLAVKEHVSKKAFVLRVMETAGRFAHPALRLLRPLKSKTKKASSSLAYQTIQLGTIKAREIVTFVIQQSGTGWRAVRGSCED